MHYHRDVYFDREDDTSSYIFDCPECMEIKDKMDVAGKELKELLTYIYGKKTFNHEKFENLIDELCRSLNIEPCYDQKMAIQGTNKEKNIVHFAAELTQKVANQ